MTIDSHELARVLGGVCLQPGATADTPNPLTDNCGPKIGLQPGATADTPNPLRPILKRLRLQPGATPGTPHPIIFR